MLKYNLCFIRDQDQILLLNREKPGWMGCWNGVGGKLEQAEDPRTAMVRELQEETGLEHLDLQFKGINTWTSLDNTKDFGGLYLYVAELRGNLPYKTPVQTDEGILQWKNIDWIMHPQNLGVAYNLPNTLRLAFNDERCFDHHSVYKGNILVEEQHTEISPDLETNQLALANYLQKKYL